ncbi:MAG: hypothetical protein NC429_04145 [Lachnospiraceae bacterium]|nr:hypothetical protein [Lachnospiraceae bacterium]
MKRNKAPYRICFLLFLLTALLECIMIEAFMWAGFHGFGDPPMIYTSQGNLAVNILTFLPGAILIIFYVLKLYRWKLPAGICWKYIFTALCGIGIGIILFFADACAGQILQPFVKQIIRLLEHSAWMEYPAP